MQTREARSFCMECYNKCPVLVTVEDGVITRVAGNPEAPYTQGRLCPKGVAALMRVYDPHRVRKPLKRTNPEKGVGVDPKWQEITWDEALDIVYQRLKHLREHNPKGLKMPTTEQPRRVMHFCLGFAFGSRYVGSAGGTGGGVYCGNSVHALGHQLWGSMHDWPEYTYTKYALFIGTNTGFESDRSIPVAGKRIADARLRGMKLVVVDPRFTHTAAKADEWIPIRPGTDGAFVLGLLNLMLNEYHVYDAPFLQQHTNAPYLIGPDGYYVRDPETKKPLIWDAAEGRAKPFPAFSDEVSCRKAALDGKYMVNGVLCQPAFQLLKDQAKDYTPQRVEEITTVPAATVRRVAREFGENAGIGGTIEIEGVSWPLRGSTVVSYRGTQGHVNSSLTTQAIYALQMVVGAMGTPGGTGPAGGAGYRLHNPTLTADPDGTVAFDLGIGRAPSAVTWPPTEYDLGSYIPLDVVGANHLHYVTGVDPTQWGLDPEMVVFADNTNPVMAVGDLNKQVTYHRNAFVVVLEQYLTETAELADIVLPSDSQLERYNLTSVQAGPEYLGLVYSEPAIPSLSGTRDYWDVAIELWDRLGLLRGEGGFNWWINQVTRLKPGHALDLEKRYTSALVQEILAKDIIGEDGWEQLVARGVYSRKVPASEKYLPFRPARLAFYNEFILRTGAELVANLKKAGAYDRLASELDFAYYVPLPTWKPAPIHHTNREYDLYAVNGKTVLHGTSRTPFNPWLMELAEKDPYVLKVWINSATAKKKGIQDGQRIWVESAAGRVQGEAKVTEGIHPECVGIAGKLGHWCDHPVAKGKGVHFNTLVELSLKNTNPLTSTLQSCAVRVRVYTAK